MNKPFQLDITHCVVDGTVYGVEARIVEYVLTVVPTAIASSLTFDWEYGWGDDSRNLIVKGERPETEKEKNTRLKQQEAARKNAAEKKKQKESDELQEYERLKKKYGEQS